LQPTHTGGIPLGRREGELEPIGGEGKHQATLEDLEALSLIIKELNERFGTDFTDEDKVFIRELEERLKDNQALTASVRSSPPENARLSFDYVVTDQLQDMIEANFKFYKRITDDNEFGEFFLEWLFDRFRRTLE
jgi:type I restriction enzyme R subunit